MVYRVFSKGVVVGLACSATEAQDLLALERAKLSDAEFGLCGVLPPFSVFMASALDPKVQDRWIRDASLELSSAIVLARSGLGELFAEILQLNQKEWLSVGCLV